MCDGKQLPWINEAVVMMSMNTEGTLDEDTWVGLKELEKYLQLVSI